MFKILLIISLFFIFQNEVYSQSDEQEIKNEVAKFRNKRNSKTSVFSISYLNTEDRNALKIYVYNLNKQIYKINFYKKEFIEFNYYNDIDLVKLKEYLIHFDCYINYIKTEKTK